MRGLLLAAALLSAGPASAAAPKDLEGAWLGRMGCNDGAFRVTLRVSPQAFKGWTLRYSLLQLSGKGGSRGGAGALRPDGALSIANPSPNPLLPDSLAGKLDFEEGSPRFKGRTELGAAEKLAGATARCLLEEKDDRLGCDFNWRLLEDVGVCRLRLLRKGPDKGPLPCPEGYKPSRRGTSCRR